MSFFFFLKLQNTTITNRLCFCYVQGMAGLTLSPFCKNPIYKSSIHWQSGFLHIWYNQLYTSPSLYIKKKKSRSRYQSWPLFVTLEHKSINGPVKSLSLKSLQIDFALWQMFFFLLSNVITVRENDKKKKQNDVRVCVIHLEFDYHRDARLSLSVSVVCSLEGVMCTLSFTCSTVVPGICKRRSQKKMQ